MKKIEPVVHRPVLIILNSPISECWVSIGMQCLPFRVHVEGRTDGKVRLGEHSDRFQIVFQAIEVKAMVIRREAQGVRCDVRAVPWLKLPVPVHCLCEFLLCSW